MWRWVDAGFDPHAYAHTNSPRAHAGHALQNYVVTKGRNSKYQPCERRVKMKIRLSECKFRVHKFKPGTIFKWRMRLSCSNRWEYETTLKMAHRSSTAPAQSLHMGNMRALFTCPIRLHRMGCNIYLSVIFREDARLVYLWPGPAVICQVASHTPNTHTHTHSIKVHLNVIACARAR